MTDLKYSLLKTLYNSPRREAEQKTLFDIDVHHPNKIYPALKDLTASGLIKRVNGSNKHSLTTLGAEKFEQEQELRKQTSKKKTQHIITIVIAVLTLLATIFLSEPFIKFITWLTAEKS